MGDIGAVSIGLEWRARLTGEPPACVDRYGRSFVPNEVWWSTDDNDEGRAETYVVLAEFVTGGTCRTYRGAETVPEWVPRPPDWLPVVRND